MTAIKDVLQNANEHRDKYPTLHMLLEEVAELASALVGEHEHSPEFELIQIGGIAVNWLRRIYAAKQTGTRREE